MHLGGVTGLASALATTQSRSGSALQARFYGTPLPASSNSA
jgi:hypothetical protein